MDGIQEKIMRIGIDSFVEMLAEGRPAGEQAVTVSPS